MRRALLAIAALLLVPAIARADGDQDGYAPPQDCDDNNPAVHPFAQEDCNGIDDDCASYSTPYGPSWVVHETDLDGDGYVACGPWTGPAPVLPGGDCRPTNPQVYPASRALLRHTCAELSGERGDRREGSGTEAEAEAREKNGVEERDLVVRIARGSRVGGLGRPRRQGGSHLHEPGGFVLASGAV